MTDKRFKIVNLRDGNICDIQDTSQEILTFYNDLTYNFGSAKAICDLLNEFHEENKKLKQVNEMLQMDFAMTERNLMEENEELKKELFELKKDYILETYADNPVRRDEKLKSLEEELR